MQGPGEQFGQLTGLVAAVDGAENQFDRPLGGDALGFEGIGQPETADHQIGPLGPHPLQLFLHILALAEAGACRQQASSSRVRFNLEAREGKSVC